MNSILTLDTAVKSEDLFSSLSSEGEQSKDKGFEFLRTQGLNSLLNGFNEMVNSKNELEELYKFQMEREKLDKFIPKDYSNDDLQKMIEILVSMDYDRELFNHIDIYFNEAILRYPDKEINIDLSKLRKMHSLGVLNNGKIITFNGDTGSYLGGYMSSGKIILNGNCEYLIGGEMSGGEIHLNGDYGAIGRNITGGLIYHKGKLIVNNGKWVDRSEE